MKNKKAQHEIVGFVLIIIIVSIIGLIFLSFMIGRGEPITQESVKISNLLSASMYYTSDCAINYVPNYKNGQDLIKECFENSLGVCLNQEKVCDSLNSTMKKMIEDSLDVDLDKPNKAYELLIYYRDSDENLPDEQILGLAQGVYGNCSSEIGGWHFINVGGIAPGTINVELDVCKS
tara:strand:+ start:93 stop:623 length:531 start_codon:yes stop_codon:yes gene_type:complete